MKKFYGKHFRSTDLLIFSFIAIMGVLFVCFITTILVYDAYKKEFNEKVAIKTTRIDVVLSETFNVTERILESVGNQIAQLKQPTPKNILNVFERYTRIGQQEKGTFSWSLYDWINTDGLQIINSKNGILNQPLNMSDRAYISLAKSQPWKLHLSQPAIGKPSGIWIIPAGLGVAFGEEHIGTISMGFSIAELATRINKMLDNSGISFVVLDDNYNVVLKSEDLDFSPETTFFKKAFRESQLLPSYQGPLTSPLTTDEVEFVYQRKIVDYPYLILAGKSTNLLSQEFQAILLPRLSELLGVGVFAVVLLYFFRKRVVKPLTELSDAAIEVAKGNKNAKIPRTLNYEMHILAIALTKMKVYKKRDIQKQKQLKSKSKELKKAVATLTETKDELEHYIHLAENSENARERFARQVHHTLKEPLSSIRALIEMYMMRHTGSKEAGKHLTPETELKYLKEAYKGCLQLNSLISEALDLSHFDIKDAMSECLLIKERDALQNKVTTSITYAKNLGTIYSDEIKCKQVITSLLSRLIEFSPKDTHITIDVKIRKKDKRRHLFIEFKDNAYGIDQSTREKWRKMQDEGGLSRRLDGTDLARHAIEMLVRVLGGKVIYIDELRDHSKIELWIPDSMTLKEEPLKIPEVNTKGKSKPKKKAKKGNIIDFSHHKKKID